MDAKPHYFKIGVFVLIAVALIVVAVILFGAGLFGQERRTGEAMITARSGSRRRAPEARRSPVGKS